MKKTPPNPCGAQRGAHLRRFESCLIKIKKRKSKLGCFGGLLKGLGLKLTLEQETARAA